MPKLVWNGGFEMDWKTVTAILWCAFITGGAWYKLDAMAITQKEMSAKQSEQINVVTIHSLRLSSLEDAINVCCPKFRKATRKDWP